MSWSLVGIKWSLSLQKGIQYEVRPLPFVVETTNSDAFWISLVMSSLIILIFLIYFLFNSMFVSSVYLFLTLTCNIVNIFFFIKCQNLARTQQDKQVRSLLLETAQFEHVNESDYSSNDEKNEGNKHFNEEENDEFY